MNPYDGGVSPKLGPIDAIRQALHDMPSAPPPNATPDAKSTAGGAYEAQQTKVNDLVKQGVLAYYEADTGKPQAAAGTADYDAQLKDMEAPQNRQKFEEAKASLLAAISVPPGESSALGKKMDNSPGSAIGSVAGSMAATMTSMTQPLAVKNALADLQLVADVHNAQAQYTDSNGHVSSDGVLAGINTILSERGSSPGALSSFMTLPDNATPLTFANSGSALKEVLSQFSATIDSNQFNAGQTQAAKQDLQSLLMKLPVSGSQTDLQSMALERQAAAPARQALELLDHPNIDPNIVIPEPKMPNSRVTHRPDVV